jgi:Co/Zn/Cd efflux system component
MAGGCCSHESCASSKTNDLTTGWRRALWVAFAVNASMFLTEILAGATAGSTALQADAMDFLGDAANYAISIGVIGMGLAWRARAALLKGGALLLLGVWVAGSAVWQAALGTLPAAEIMGGVGILALAANAGVAWMLFRFRGGDSNMRSVWICSRNDAVGNMAVVAAAAGVFGTGTGWPDIIVAIIMSVLGVSGGWQIMRHARRELSTGQVQGGAMKAGAEP